MFYHDAEFAAAQQDQIKEMLFSGKLTGVRGAGIVGCSERSIQTI
jgi:hypothetical protein